MKKLIAVLLTAGTLAGLTGGCSVPSDQANGAEEGASVGSTMEKAEQVEFLDGSGDVLRTLTTNEELNAFFDTLDLGDDWGWADEPEEELTPSLSAVFLQTPTQTVFGKKVEEGELEEVARLTLYEGSSIAEVRVALFSFYAVLPAETVQALYDMSAA